MTAIFVGILLAAGMAQSRDTSPHSEVSLVSSASKAAPGRKFLVGVKLQLEPGWHCYWQNPGDSGQATSVAWNLPKGWRVSGIMWPTPETLDADGFTVYGYEKEAILLAYVTIPASAKPGRYRLEANAEWLICRETCLPAKDIAAAEIEIGSPQPDKAGEASLKKAFAELPRKPVGWKVRAVRKPKGFDLILEPGPGVALAGVRFMAADPETIAHSTPQTFREEGHTYVLGLTRSEFASKPPKRLRGLLVGTGTGSGIEIDVPVTPS